MKSGYFTRLSKNTFIYGSGQIISRMITFCMLPLSTRYLMPEDYGVLGILAVLALSVFGLFTLGFGASLPRKYGDAATEEERAVVIWSGFFTLLLNMALWVAVGALFLKPLSYIVLGTNNYDILVFATLLNAAFANLQLPFLNFFKIRERAFLVVAITLVELVVSLSLIVYWVFYCQWGCYGMVYAGAIGQATTFFLLLLSALATLPIHFSRQAVKEMVKIGYPYIVGVVGTFIMQSAARYILQMLDGREEVAMFFMGSNFGKFVELIVTAFMSAWIPFSVEFIYKREEARVLFGQFISYYSMAISLVVLLFFVMSKPVVMMMVQPIYFRVWPLVGIMATAYSCWGLYTMLSCCFTFNKRSVLQVFTEIAAGITCVVLSFLLIPYFGSGGAAAASLLGYLALVFITHLFCRKLLPIRYETPRLARVAVAFIAAAGATYLPIEPLALYCTVMALVFGGYALFLYRLCLTESERFSLKSKLGFKPAYEVT